MLIKCLLFILGLVLYIRFIYPLLNIIESLFSSKKDAKLDELPPKLSNQLIHQILDWCIINIHLNKERRVKPSLFISKRRKTDFLGSYQFYNKKITIYLLKHSSIQELCDTIIHEYVHHLQIRTVNDDIRYNRLTRQKSYWENDFEVEARHIALKFTNRCLKELNL